MAYATRLGGTERLAREMAQALREEGVHTDVAPIGEVRNVSTYDAVLVGSPLQEGKWLPDAVRFVRRNRRPLRSRSVWLFHVATLPASGTYTVALPPDVLTLAQRIGAIGVLTLGGTYSPATPEVTPDHSGVVTNQDSVHRCASLIADRLRHSRAS